MSTGSALADYAPQRAARKHKSDAPPPDLALERVPKVLPVLRGLAPRARIVGWKLEDSLDAAVAAARARLSEYGLDGVVANATTTLGSDRTEARLVLPDGVVPLSGTKEDAAEALFAAFAGRARPSERDKPPAAAGKAAAHRRR